MGQLSSCMYMWLCVCLPVAVYIANIVVKPNDKLPIKILGGDMWLQLSVWPLTYDNHYEPWESYHI